MGKGKQVADVKTEEIPGDQLRSLTNNHDAIVTTEDGTVGTGSGVTKEDAIAGAATDAGAEADDDADD